MPHYAERILEFDGAKIAETAAYDEPVERGGVFGELVRSAEGRDPSVESTETSLK